MMSEAHDYQIINKIYESSHSLVYRAIFTQNQQPIVLKVLKEDYPSPAQMTRYKQEYEITRSLTIEGVIQAYELRKRGNTLAMFLEDFGGESLSQILSQSQSFTLLEFLTLAIRLCEILEAIHSANIIHKDINPSNIVFNSQTKQLKIIDFGIATAFTRENPTIKNPDVLEGTLAYMSPEQTGRMNRLLDYRTDLYSLGITFYQLLTHKLPFETTDTLELVHCHIARQPIPPDQIDPKIPKGLSDIVVKLLAKTVEDRYQSAWGVKADLEVCLSQLQTTGTILEFPLAQQDSSGRFQIPQKLYGREREVGLLLDAFERVAGGMLVRVESDPLESDPLESDQAELDQLESGRSDSTATAAGLAGATVELVLVAGYSGIGKSVLVQELYKPITRQRGYFIAGKFDQFQRNIPYSAVAKAFRSLVEQLLTESEARLAEWRAKLLEAFGANGQVVIDVIPDVEKIVGPQPPIQPLEPTEAQTRFNLVFQNFLHVLCQAEHPLVIFLDDLQWADLASLKLIERIVTDPEIRYLLVIGAYRDNEVDLNHPLAVLIDRLQTEGRAISQITLAPLNLDNLCQLMAETLLGEIETVRPLAELVASKTSGNPFFVNEFLRTIYQENLLVFEPKQRIWQWDITQIEALAITDNVVDLMLIKMRKLAESTQQVLRWSACIGNSFDLDTLSIIYEKSAAETFQDLLPAARANLVQPTSTLEMTAGEAITSSLVVKDYKFLHDRVQQAAYSLIEEDQRKATHLKIGRLLQNNINPEDLESQVFTLVDHLNKGRELMQADGEKINLARLNLKAGKKAKEATAYAAARDYFQVALDQLPATIWSDDYDLALDLHRELAEVEYLNGNFEYSQALIDQSLQQTRSALDSADFYFLLIVQFTLLGKYLEAIEVGRLALKGLEVDLPEKGLKAAVKAELSVFEANLEGREVSSLIDLPEMSNIKAREAVKLLTKLASTAWVVNPPLMHLIVTKQVNLNIQYGHTQKSSVSYSFFAAIHSHVLHEYRRGYEFGLLSLKLAEQYNDLSARVEASQLVANMSLPWIKHVKYAEPINRKIRELGPQSGNLQTVGYNMSYTFFNFVYAGKELGFLKKEGERFLQYAIDTKNQIVIDCMVGFKMAISNLLGLTSTQWDFDLDEITEAEYLATSQKGAICWFYLFKNQILYLYGRPAALNYFQEIETLVNYVPGTLSVAMNNFYYSLALIAAYPNAPADQQKHYWKKLKDNQKWLKLWSDNCPSNFLHQYLLIEAEIARITEKWQVAMELYDRAIESAREQEFIQNQALANELAAKFWLSRGKTEFAQLYFKKARQAYQIWGAKRKVEELDEKYPEWLSVQPSRISSPLGAITTTTTSRESGEALDLITVMRASQAISGEIVLSQLLGKLMKTVIENAGAETGLLLLEQEGRWMIEAEGRVDSEGVAILRSNPPNATDRPTGNSMDHSTAIDAQMPDQMPDQMPILPSSLINYVARTQGSVVLNDATNEGQFTRDPYILAIQPKSILCAPLIHQGKLSGILYLENNLTTGAFTDDRVEILRILSAQAAISIENSRLYAQLADYSHTLEQKVEERTQELQEKNQELGDTLQKLQLTQAQIIAQEKLASLGALTAGIAHEIKNPLNFVNNFAELSVDITSELNQELASQMDRLDPYNRTYIEELLHDLAQNAQKIKEHGERADNIVHGMLMHSRGHQGERQLTDINLLLADAINLVYHGIRAKSPTFDITIETHYDEHLPSLTVVPQNISRAFLNILGNACDAAYAKAGRVGAGFVPQIQVITQDGDGQIQIRIRDNGNGIAQEIITKIFDPFFTTKPTGQGTGLGLSISHDIIVQEHQGSLRVETEVGNYAEFIITLPKASH